MSGHPACLRCGGSGEYETTLWTLKDGEIVTHEVDGQVVPVTRVGMTPCHCVTHGWAVTEIRKLDLPDAEVGNWCKF